LIASRGFAALLSFPLLGFIERFFSRRPVADARLGDGRNKSGLQAT
jgi:hypothetical protein